MKKALTITVMLFFAAMASCVVLQVHLHCAESKCHEQGDCNDEHSGGHDSEDCSICRELLLASKAVIAQTSGFSIFASCNIHQFSRGIVPELIISFQLRPRAPPLSRIL